MTPALVVLAKAPVAGRSKTRLCPPLSLADAARVAEACLIDTLATVRSVRTRRVLALDGEPGAWLPDGFEVIPQRGIGLGERIAAAFEDVGDPAMLIGMDTPQVTPSLLRSGMHLLDRADAVYAPADDGGWWALGLRSPDRRVFDDVPMSTPWTGAAQHQRLHALGLRHEELPSLNDVDDIADARAVAAELPASRVAAVLRAIEHGAGGWREGAAWLAGHR